MCLTAASMDSTSIPKAGFFDSGIGGTCILEAFKRLCPDVPTVYIADSANCPYGEKTDDELWQIVSHNVEQLKSQGAAIIVIACNTATTRCIDRLRQTYPELHFIGTEPAIKLACEHGGKQILVMATPGTVKADRTQALIAKHQTPEQQITLLSCAGLADAIEFKRDVSTKLNELLGSLPKDYDTIVLGCTHYSLIKDQIQKYFPRAKLIDGNAGIARRVATLVK